VPLSDYAAVPRDVSFSFWCGGRECAAPVVVTLDTDDHDAIAALAFAEACTWPASGGVCDANEKEAMEALRELDGVDGWKLQPADRRGMNLGGAELQREFPTEDWATVGLYCDELSGQWIVSAWNGRTDDGNAMTAETFDTPAAEHGGELCSDDALRIVRDTQARLTLNAPADSADYETQRRANAARIADALQEKVRIKQERKARGYVVATYAGDAFASYNFDAWTHTGSATLVRDIRLAYHYDDEKTAAAAAQHFAAFLGVDMHAMVAP
jgi:hypothetical protein